MLAIDTNILVRFLTADEPGQFAQSRSLIAGEPVWVSLTVLVETAWVLRSSYRVAAATIVERLTAFVGLPTVTTQDESAVRQALAWAAEGMGIADAFHLAQARGCDAFITFDRALAARALSLATVPPVRPPS